MNTQWKLIRNRKLVGSLAAVVAATCLGTASAESIEPRYTMSAISDAAHGGKIIAGEYESAIRKINRSKRVFGNGYYTETNLCVAYVMTRNLVYAQTACDLAVDKMKRQLKVNRGPLHMHKAKANRRYLAMAYSNRGVLYAIKGESELAREDFEKALALDTELPLPAVNLDRLQINLAQLPENREPSA